MEPFELVFLDQVLRTVCQRNRVNFAYIEEILNCTKYNAKISPMRQEIMYLLYRKGFAVRIIKGVLHLNTEHTVRQGINKYCDRNGLKSIKFDYSRIRGATLVADPSE